MEDDLTINELKLFYEAQIEALKKETRWRTFDEQLPKIRHRILIRYSYYGWEEVVSLNEEEINEFKTESPQMRWLPIPETGRTENI